MKQSAGTLLYRPADGGWQVLLVRPSGPAARYGWSIPKGIPNAGESLEAAARRETLEEAGVAAGDLIELGHADYQKSRKRIHCFAGPVAQGEPRAASWEVDQAVFLSLDDARQRIHPDQRVFIDRLEAHLRGDDAAHDPSGERGNQPR